METRKAVIFHLMLVLAVLVLLPFRASARHMGVQNHISYSKKYYHDFIVKSTPCARLCETKNILTVNGQFPGPTLHAHKGDSLFINVHNHAQHNITLHWHGVRLQGNPWSDGAAYITQAPIQPGQNYTYRIKLTEEEGTFWWHAHNHASRATVHGAIVVYPSHGSSYPFPKPHKEVPIILGEWWKKDVIDVYNEAKQTGAHPMHSDAYTINGQPGYLYSCSQPDTFMMPVEPGKAYLLRLISAAMDEQLFFAVASHRLTLVAIDGSYTKPLDTDFVMISPGQTMDVLVHADQPPADYAMAASPFDSGMDTMDDLAMPPMPPMPPMAPNNATTALFHYTNASTKLTPTLPPLPSYNDSHSSNNFTSRIRSLTVNNLDLQQLNNVDVHMFVTLSMNLLDCGGRNHCHGPMGMRGMASMNNVSFVEPETDVLKAYYYKMHGVYETDFPDEPPVKYDYTGVDPMDGGLFSPEVGTKVKVVEWGQDVEIVFQATNLVSRESHPMHLHGHSFYVVGWGFGNFDPDTDPLKYNLVDPARQSTVAVPRGGWAAIRFKADNPGVWFLHCHFEHHLGVGMGMVFIVKDGRAPLHGLTRMWPPPRPTSKVKI